MSKLKVIISPAAQAKIDFWVGICKYEISGMGTVQRLGDVAYIDEVYLLDQVVTGTETEITAEAMGKLEFKARGSEGTLNFWWHSHADMGVFWSQTDHEQMKEFADVGWIIATVFNKKGQSKSAYRQGECDFYPAVFMDDLPTKSKELLSEEENDALSKEFNTKVKKKAHTPKVTNITGGNHNSHSVGYWDYQKNKWVQHTKHGWAGKSKSGYVKPDINEVSAEDMHQQALADYYKQNDIDTNESMNPTVDDGIVGDLDELTDEGLQTQWRELANSFYPNSTPEEQSDFYTQYKDDARISQWLGKGLELGDDNVTT